MRERLRRALTVWAEVLLQQAERRRLRRRRPDLQFWAQLWVAHRLADAAAMLAGRAIAKRPSPERYHDN